MPGPTEQKLAIMWRIGERECISDTQLRLNCVDLAAKTSYAENDPVDLAQRIYDFVTDQK